MEWSEEETIQLIDIYKSKPLLWYPKHEDHFKKHLKEDAWREIAAAMAERSIDDCKKKVVCLLASFRREKAKIKKSQSTGKGKSILLLYYTNVYTCFELNS